MTIATLFLILGAISFFVGAFRGFFVPASRVSWTNLGLGFVTLWLFLGPVTHLVK